MIAATTAALLGVVLQCGLAYANCTVKYDLDPHTVKALRVLGKKPCDFRLPGSVPDPTRPAGTDMLGGIDHIITVMFENHSFDNIYGTLDRDDAEGFPMDPCTSQPTTSNPFENGTLLQSYKMPMTCVRCDSGPSPNWLSSHDQYNNGSMDGFVLGNGVKPCHMGYFTPEQLPFQHSLAKIFPLGDRYFCSVLGQTWPNRMYAIGATSLGIVDTGQNLTGRPIAPTIFDNLDTYGISWRNYVAGFGQADSESTLQLFPGDESKLLANGRPLEQFFTDAAAGTLPSFSWIDLNGTTQSQENPQNVVVGEAFMSDIVNAVGSSPLWNNTLLFINYDEHGGYFDHVPPPEAIAPDSIAPVVPPRTDNFTAGGGFEYEGYHRYGFRVPAVVVSPYAKQDHVSHVVHDHSSFLALLERKWNLPALTYRDANANDLTDFIDLDALRNRCPTFPDLMAVNLAPPGNTTEALACSNGTNLIWPPAEAYRQSTPIPVLDYANASLIKRDMLGQTARVSWVDRRSSYHRKDDFFLPQPMHGW